MHDASIRLMDLSHGAGCGCKLGPGDLHAVLASLPPQSRDERVLVGTETGDDAAVVRVSAELAIVSTTDFFTPILNDPYRFGQVAAANALSDIYAMGGRPLCALSLVAFPLETLGPDVLGAILRGGQDKAAEAGIRVVGGHSIDDREPKYGLAVTGTIHPDRITRNRGARAGDALVLTKPLGAGVLTTAVKRSLATAADEAAVFANMAALNAPAGAVLESFFGKIHAATDVTGFGLTGHLWGMLKDGGLRAEIQAAALPLLPRAAELAAEGCFPGGTKRNLAYLEGRLRFAPALAAAHGDVWRRLAADPQTSGGVLLAVDPAAVAEVRAALSAAGAICAVEIGKVTSAGTDGEAIWFE